MHWFVIYVQTVLTLHFLYYHHSLMNCIFRCRFIALAKEISEAIAAAWAGIGEFGLRLLAPVCADCRHEWFEAGCCCCHDGEGNFDLCPGGEENAIKAGIGGEESSEKVVDPQGTEYNSPKFVK